MKHDPSLFHPQPIKGFHSKNVFFIPVDSASGIIRKHLQSISLRHHTTPFGQLFHIPSGTVLYQCIGAPAAVLNLERLIASGAKDILLLGFCGALSSDANIGDCIVTTNAIADEGTSVHYLPDRDGFSPSSSLQQHTEAYLKSLRIQFRHGVVISTDAPFRETESWLDRSRHRGAGFVDMETSALFALAEFHGIRAAALLIVSDILSSGNHLLGFRSAKLSHQIKRCFLPHLTP